MNEIECHTAKAVSLAHEAARGGVRGGKALAYRRSWCGAWKDPGKSFFVLSRRGRTGPKRRRPLSRTVSNCLERLRTRRNDRNVGSKSCSGCRDGDIVAGTRRTSENGAFSAGLCVREEGVVDTELYAVLPILYTESRETCGNYEAQTPRQPLKWRFMQSL